MNVIKPHRKDVTEKLNIKLLNLWSTLLNLGLSKCHCMPYVQSAVLKCIML